MSANVSRFAESPLANCARAWRSSCMPRIKQVSSAGTATASATRDISLVLNERNRRGPLPPVGVSFDRVVCVPENLNGASCTVEPLKGFRGGIVQQRPALQRQQGVLV